MRIKWNVGTAFSLGESHFIVACSFTHSRHGSFECKWRNTHTQTTDRTHHAYISSQQHISSKSSRTTFIKKKKNYLTQLCAALILNDVFAAAAAAAIALPNSYNQRPNKYFVSFYDLSSINWIHIYQNNDAKLCSPFRKQHHHLRWLDICLNT